MKKTEDYVSMHVHSDLSSLDGACKIADYLEVARERGAPALAITDHGTMRGFYDLLSAANEAEDAVKPIYGVEFYVSPDMHRRGLTDEEKDAVAGAARGTERTRLIKDHEETEGIRDRWHLTAWALDDVGLRNLFRLTSAAWTEGFYYKPRIDIEEIAKHNEGVAFATGCLNSPINDLWLAGKKRRALGVADRLYEILGDRLYLEIQPHNIKAQREVNGLWTTPSVRSRYREAKLLATQDSHYLTRDDAGSHDVLLCIGTAARITDPDRFRFDGDEFHFRTREEMEAAFLANHGHISDDDVKEALDNTVELAERVTTAPKIDKLRALLPAVEMPEGYKSEMAYVRDLCIEGMRWRDISGRAKKIAEAEGITHAEMLQRYGARLRHELGELNRKRFLPYFLVVRELYDWAREKKIMCGPGRGSSAGSLVAFLLGITSVDPLEHKLIFERFISPARPELPDIDMDWEDARRGEIIEYLVEKYGRANVCQIATHGKLTGKQVLKDVSRVFNVPFAESNMITDHVMERDSGDERAFHTVEDSIEQSKELRDFAESYPDVITHAIALEGLTKTLGIHAAGIIASPVPLTDIIPLESRTRPPSAGPGPRIVVSALDMEGVQAMGLVKLDVLGLRTLTYLRMCVEEVERRHGVRHDLEALSLDDPDTLQCFTDGDFMGVFQFDSVSSRKLCAGITFTHFEDIATMTAINRPGATRSGLAEQYVERKKEGISVTDLSEEEVFHEKVRAITVDTLGVLVYQEHLMRVFGEVAGFSPAEVERVRKIVGKREGAEAMERERPAFLDGVKSATPDMSEETANKLFGALVQAGAYQFNKSHATAYSIVAYWCAWLKIRYPIEFSWALVSVEPELSEIRRIAKDATRRHSIAFLPPDVSTSRETFSIDPDSETRAIRGSLLHVRGVGPAACEKIIAAQPYTSVSDLITRGKANRTVLRVLTSAGALDGIAPNRKWLIDAIADPDWWKLVKRAGWELRVDREVAESIEREAFTEEEELRKAGEVNPFSFGAHPLDIVASTIDALGVELEVPSNEDFWKKEHAAWVAGVVANAHVSQVGDYHTGPAPTEDERRRMGWGQRYANATVETDDGQELRVKIGNPLFDDVVGLIKEGTPVLLFGRVHPKWQKMHADVVLSLDVLGRLWTDYQIRASAAAAGYDPGPPVTFTHEQAAALGLHPSLFYPWKDDAARDAACAKPSRRGAARATGVVCGLVERQDRRGKDMATFALLGPTWGLRVVVFASAWTSVKPHTKPGALVTVAGDWGDDGAIIMGHGANITPRTRPIADPAALAARSP